MNLKLNYLYTGWEECLTRKELTDNNKERENASTADPRKIDVQKNALKWQRLL